MKHDITEIFPVLSKGWVAMDKHGLWCWYSGKPIIRHPDDEEWDCGTMRDYCTEFKGMAFDFKKAKSWKESLLEVK